MPLLRFESFLASPLQAEALSALTDARERVLLRHAMCFDDGKHRDARLPEETSFFSLPQQLLYAYEEHREESELGRVFQIANGMHDRVDALVVLGNAKSTSGVRALFHTCCDPYHNELSRAQRGAKPRVYFSGDAFDNDAIQSLMLRIKAGGYGDLSPESNWALVTIGEDRPTKETEFVFRQLMELRPTSNTVIAAKQSPLTTRAESLGAETLLQSCRALGPRNVLSPAGLLPAAFLGLDCVQLLVGAHQMNEHFRTATLDENKILQYAAILLGKRVQTRYSEKTSTLCIWSQTHAELARWWQDLLRANLQPIVLAADSKANLESSEDNDGSMLHLTVDAARTDGVVAPDEKNSVLAKLQDEIGKTIARQSANGLNVALVSLPVIDANSLGQLIEFFLLTSAVLEQAIECPH